MPVETQEISVSARNGAGPAVTVNGRPIVVTGRLLRIAAVQDEEWLEGEVVGDPERAVAALRDARLGVDIFTFAQKFSNPAPARPYPFEWDNVAAVRITTYDAWWKGMPQESRKNVRRAERRGVMVRLAEFNDELVQGIKKIYDETPIRQGRRFWHYGKDLETVRRENATYPERCQWVGAYHEGQLIGFLKMVYIGRVAQIMQILSLNAHFDKRPANALLAKAMEACCQHGATHFVYGKYVYGNKHNSPVTEFKKRNGFEPIQFPRYYIPLTLKGRWAIQAKLHHGVSHLIPEKILTRLLQARSRYYERKHGVVTTGKPVTTASPAADAE